MKKVLITFLALTCIAGARFANAGTHVWSGAQNGLWSNPANWSIGGAPSPIEAAPVIVQFPPTAGVRRETTNDLANIKLNALAFFGANYTIYTRDPYPVLTLVGGPPPSPYAYNLVCGGTNNAIAMSLALWNDVSIGVGANEDLTINGSMTGPGGFTKYHVGTLTLETSYENSYGGLTKVLDGTLVLNSHSFGFFGGWDPQYSIPGALVVGDANMARSPKVISIFRGQFKGAFDLTINPNGTLDLQGCAANVATLTMTGGTLSLTRRWVNEWGGSGWVYGALGIHSNLVSHPTPLSTATISGAGGVVAFYRPPDAPQSFIDVEGGEFSIEAKITDAEILVKRGPGTLILTGTNQYNADTIVSDGVVIAGGDKPFGIGFGSTVTVSNGAQIVVNNSFTAPNKFRLNGYGTNQTGAALIVQKDWATFYGTVTADSPTAVLVPNSLHTLTFGDGLTGPGELHKKGLGTLQVSGTPPSPMSGALLVDEGTLLLLNNTPAVAAVTGPLVIGKNLPNGTTAEVKLLNHNLISPGVPITINDSGALNLFGYDQAVGPLTLHGGDIKTYEGMLTLKADVLATNGLGSIISGNVSLGSVKRAFHIAPGYNINIQAQVSDTGAVVGFDKLGAGSLTLSGSNTFFGPANVLEGLLYARNNHALGNPSMNTIVANGARLAIDGRNLGTEGIILSGDGGGSGALSCGGAANVCNGVISLYADSTINVAGGNDRLTLGGLINGPGGILKIGAGTLAFTGNSPNAYSGTMTVSEGGLELAKTNSVAVPWGLDIGDNVSPPGSAFVRALRASQIGNYAPVTINASGSLDLGGLINLPQAIGSLSGTGPLNLGLSTLTLGANNFDTTYAGTITGFGASSLVKVGTSKWTLNGNSGQFLGSTKINGGAVKASIWMPFSPVTVNPGAALHGDGTLGDVASLGGTIYEDEFWVHPLEVKNLTLDSATTLRFDLKGPQATGLSRLSVNGAVNLGGAKLDVALKYASTVGTKFQIITNDGNDNVLGTFKDLDEGAKFVRGTAQFQITYKGGSGNDVVLTHIASVAPPQLSTIEPLGNGQKKITGTGWPVLTYTVEASTDLKAWMSIGTATAASPGGELSFIDPNAPNFTHRFYRFVSP